MRNSLWEFLTFKDLFQDCQYGDFLAEGFFNHPIHQPGQAARLEIQDELHLGRIAQVLKQVPAYRPGRPTGHLEADALARLALDDPIIAVDPIAARTFDHLPVSRPHPGHLRGVLHLYDGWPPEGVILSIQDEIKNQLHWPVDNNAARRVCRKDSS